LEVLVFLRCQRSNCPRLALSLLRPAVALAIAAVAVACGGAPVAQDAPDDPASGGVELAISEEWNTPNPGHTLTLDSEILGETRRVYVQLPGGYEGSPAYYPVLVVLDGEWLYELAQSHVKFLSEYHAMDPSIPRMIVVGIEGTDRDRDFTPTENSGWEHEFATAGGADDFLRFLDEELLPLIDRKYRTLPGRTIAGWSFGGLLAMYSAVATPDLFNSHLCISPAIWWDGDLVFDRFANPQFDRPKRMVITLGTGEEGGMVHTSTTKIVERFEKDPIENLEVSLIEFEGVGHSWGIPAAFDRGLRKLYSGFVASEEDAGTLEEVDAYYLDLSRSWGYPVNPPAEVMFRLASAQDDKHQAIAIVDRLLAYEPGNSLAHFYQGRYRQKLELNDAALESYQKALAAELRMEPPNSLRLRWYRESIAEVMDVQHTGDSPDEDV
jgi:predicted alpha/beta superfamily hydrolase